MVVIALTLTFAQLAPGNLSVAERKIKEAVVAMGYVSQGPVVWSTDETVYKSRGFHGFEHADVYGHYSALSECVISASYLDRAKSPGLEVTLTDRAKTILATAGLSTGILDFTEAIPENDDNEAWSTPIFFGDIKYQKPFMIEMNGGLCQRFSLPTPLKTLPPRPKIGMDESIDKAVETIEGVSGMELISKQLCCRGKGIFDLTPVTVHQLIFRERQIGVGGAPPVKVVEFNAVSGERLSTVNMFGGGGGKATRAVAPFAWDTKISTHLASGWVKNVRLSSKNIEGKAVVLRAGKVVMKATYSKERNLLSVQHGTTFSLGEPDRYLKKALSAL